MREAKENLTCEELADWVRYRDKHGQLSPQQRMIHGFAMVAWAVCISSGVKLSGRKPKPEDFMPTKKADDGFFTMEQAAAAAKAESGNAKNANRKPVKRKIKRRK